MGSKRIYDFVDDNPVVSFMDASIANHPAVIAQNPRVTAINAAVEIDLTGQVCADSIGEMMISGVGGQVDFERGAALSPGGVPIICVPSTTSKGESRIVPTLRHGAGVVTTRPHVHFVVTEWGYANIYGGFCRLLCTCRKPLLTPDCLDFSHRQKPSSTCQGIDQHSSPRPPRSPRASRLRTLQDQLLDGLNGPLSRLLCVSHIQNHLEL